MWRSTRRWNWRAAASEERWGCQTVIGHHKTDMGAATSPPASPASPASPTSSGKSGQPRRVGRESGLKPISHSSFVAFLLLLAPASSRSSESGFGQHSNGTSCGRPSNLVRESSHDAIGRRSSCALDAIIVLEGSGPQLPGRGLGRGTTNARSHWPGPVWAAPGEVWCGPAGNHPSVQRRSGLRRLRGMNTMRAGAAGAALLALAVATACGN